METQYGRPLHGNQKEAAAQQACDKPYLMLFGIEVQRIKFPQSKEGGDGNKHKKCHLASMASQKVKEGNEDESGVDTLVIETVSGFGRLGLGSRGRAVGWLCVSHS